MGFSEYFSKQAGHPSGWFGRWIMSLIFDKGNAELNEMMKDCLQVKAEDHILEIGCGTGKLMHELAPILKSGCIEGVDISETMISMARKRNQAALADGRVIIHLGDFNSIALNENAYDAVCSCNTIYFWADSALTLNKIHSVLKPGGKLILAFEDNTRLAQKPISSEVMKIYSQKEVFNLLAATGFKGGIEIKEKSGPSAGKCCAVAYK